MNAEWKYILALLFIGVHLCSSVANCFAQDAGVFTVPSGEVGTTVQMTGKWLFKPAGKEKEVAVPVPQMLSRIQWWLDDSEDFKKWEQARLDALGFDAEKSDDGWYRAIINVPALPADRHVWIEFDGVAMKCKAFCNGKPLGEHAGMFSRFSFDLTPHLKPGKNELTVWVSMEKVPVTDAKLGQAVTVNLSAAKVVSMSKGMFGPLAPQQNNRDYDLYGIWQPVKLVVRGNGKINDVFFQSSQHFQNASVHVDIDSTTGQDYSVSASFTEPGKTSGGGSLAEEFKSKGHDRIVLAPLHEESVQVKTWTPADPNLYTLEVTLKDGAGNVVDQTRQNVGFRTFEIRGNQFYLNGHPYWLRGANQLPYGKNPWDPKLARKLIQYLHDGNLRFTRTHATPWNEAWLDAADEIGLAVSVEGIRPWGLAGKAEDGEKTLLPPPAIYQHWLMENADVVKRCRNHPSVFLWTIGNEMNLRDPHNIEKWKLLSGVVKETRMIDPTRPVVSTSSYYREQKFYNEQMKPAGIDDGDIDDIHSYNGWYSTSNFVNDSKFAKEMKDNQHKRPLIGQEFSTGYPDLDTGLPVLHYTRDLLTPQAWVGAYANPGHDPGVWLDHLSKVTKRWAEQLRFERGDNTAGFCLFSSECWFHHSYDPGSAKPYPVYFAAKQAYAPIGLALGTTQRRFWAGDAISTDVYVTNDDEQFRDFSNVTVQCSLRMNAPIDAPDINSEPVKVGTLAYYQTAKVPITQPIRSIGQLPRLGAKLMLRLIGSDGKELAASSDDVEIFAKPADLPKPHADVVIIKHGESLAGLAEGHALHDKIAAGATAIVFSPANKEIAALFPEALLADAKETQKYIEFADIAPILGTKLAEHLQPMDLKWWARPKDGRAFLGTSSERLKPDGPGRELIRYIPPHGYISPDKLAEQYRVVLCEIPVGKGRVWICDLDVDACAAVDPAARLFAEDLYAAAADPDSTREVHKIPTHEQMINAH